MKDFGAYISQGGSGIVLGFLMENIHSHIILDHYYYQICVLKVAKARDLKSAMIKPSKLVHWGLTGNH